MDLSMNRFSVSNTNTDTDTDTNTDDNEEKNNKYDKYCSRARWDFTKTIIYTLINQRATIFGGAVRDMFLHNFHATEFYSKHKNNHLKYNDPKFSPETKERFLVPSDIDCFIKEKDFNSLMRILTIKYFIKKRKSIDMTYRLLNCDKDKYTLYKIDALNSFHVLMKLDIIVSADDEPLIPQMETDFDVNRLMYSLKDKYYLREQIDNPIAFHRVIENIKNKRTICEPDIKHFRLDKMLQKGWNIIVNYKIYKFIPCEILDDKCVVCHVEFNKEHKESKKCIVRFKCDCNYYVCWDCINTNGRNIDKCVMCREEYFDDPDAALQEFTLFNDYQIMG